MAESWEEFRQTNVESRTYNKHFKLFAAFCQWGVVLEHQGFGTLCFFKTIAKKQKRLNSLNNKTYQ